MWCNERHNIKFTAFKKKYILIGNKTTYNGPGFNIIHIKYQVLIPYILKLSYDVAAINVVAMTKLNMVVKAHCPICLMKIGHRERAQKSLYTLSSYYQAVQFMISCRIL